MADGNPLLIGRANTASNPGGETVLTRNTASVNTVFVAQNVQQGGGILGAAGTDGVGVAGTSDTGSGGERRLRWCHRPEWLSPRLRSRGREHRWCGRVRLQ